MSLAPPLLLRALLALVWLINGLWAKLLGRVPRHRQIVARLLGPTYAPLLTRLIGLGEIGLAGWVLSGYEPRLCGAVQIGLVGLMNALEFWRAPDLLLWGRWNVLFAAGFMLLVAAIYF